MDDGIVLFELWDARGKKVATIGTAEGLPDIFHLKPQENFAEHGMRNAFRKNDNGSVRIIVRENSPLFQGNKALTRACAIYLSLVPKFGQYAQSERQYSDAILTRFAHNLTQFQVRFKSNFTRLISDKARARPYAQFHEEVKRRIEENTSAAADDVCQMSHRAVDLDAQIETLRIISGYADTSAPTTPVKTDLLRAIYRLTNPFVEELGKRGIAIDIQIPSPSSDNDKVHLVHSLFNAAIWQFLDNACKYALDNSPITVSATLGSRPQKLVFEMVSVCINPDEYERIFQERYKGRNAGSKAGSGIGMYIVRKALGLMGARISVENLGHVKDVGTFKYCQHRFIIEFTNSR